MSKNMFRQIGSFMKTAIIKLKIQMTNGEYELHFNGFGHNVSRYIYSSFVHLNYI